MTRHKDADWNLPDSKQPGNTVSFDTINAALLLNIRDELKRLNDLLYCVNFVGIPHTLKRIDKRLAKSHPLK